MSPARERVEAAAEVARFTYRTMSDGHPPADVWEHADPVAKEGWRAVARAVLSLPEREETTNDSSVPMPDAKPTGACCRPDCGSLQRGLKNAGTVDPLRAPGRVLIGGVLLEDDHQVCEEQADALRSERDELVQALAELVALVEKTWVNADNRIAWERNKVADAARRLTSRLHAMTPQLAGRGVGSLRSSSSSTGNPTRAARDCGGRFS